jgi:hypothetical protein
MSTCFLRMVRTGGVLALVASLGRAGFLAASVHRHPFSGTIGVADDQSCTFQASYAYDDDFWSIQVVPPLPGTFPRRLAVLRSEGTRGDSVNVCTLQLPDELRGRAEWRENPWRFRGTIAGLSLPPLLAWALASLPVLLLRKRPGAQA